MCFIISGFAGVHNLGQFLCCRIDALFVIKIADFGLSENMDISKEYFRQQADDEKKLPIKWMALESMTDAVFSEKTDIVRHSFIL
jgi:hypothetical protein